MKKLILPLVMLAMSLSSFGQIVRSTTFTKTKEHKRTDWYVRLGMSCNNLTGDAVSEFNSKNKEAMDNLDPDVEAKAGFGTRVNFDLMFGFNRFFGKTDLYWGMELGLGTRGGSYRYWYKNPNFRNDETREMEDKCHVTSYGVKWVPFQIGYQYPVTEKIKVDAHLGIWVEYDFAGTYTEDGYKKINGEEIDDDDDRIQSLNFKDDYVDGVSIDGGLQLGAGVWFGRFNLNFTWQRGFLPYVRKFPFSDIPCNKDNNELSYNTSNAIITLGVAF